MSLDGKMQSLNSAIKEALPSMLQTAEENPNASVLVRSLKFSHGAQWHVAQPTPLENFRWVDLQADPLQRPMVDIIFMIDTSGSMNNEIEAVKGSCISFAERIIKEGANVRLGLVGFDIGGHRGSKKSNYTVHNLSTYTIGVWALSSPEDFKKNINSLSLGLFGGGGCYLANEDTVDIFPHVVQAFDHSPAPTKGSESMATGSGSASAKALVIISDEMGSAAGTSKIVSYLNRASITAHVMGVPGRGSGAHELIASQTGGQFWDITRSKGAHDFSDLLGNVAQTIAKEVSKKLADGAVSAGTDMGAAMRAMAEQLKTPPMPERALPPVLVLISDGLPTDDFAAGLKALMAQPWGKKAVRISIAIGSDADHDTLQKFIGHNELKLLQANNPEALVKYIKWASTAVLKSASSPPSQAHKSAIAGLNVPIPTPPGAVPGPSSAGDVW